MKKIILSAIVLGMSFALLTGCNNRSNNQRAVLEENLGPYVVNFSTENPAIYLHLTESNKTDSTTIYLAKALNDKDTVGLQIEVSNSIPAGVYGDDTPNEEKGFVPGAIKFSSIGESSDNFVKGIASLYKLSSSGQMSNAMLSPLVFSSNKKNVDLSSNNTYNFKLFFDNATGEEAEVFAVLDLYKRLFEFRAKDSTQYERIISAFEGQ